ncbi:phospho-sugar mutase [Feifania hominis]|uniref:Phospho-sugar mutase n=1 Tax=Feifania hominis TaxID=2763660 RepID=A0A926DB77_9FIRM|nr:phospho-sugar mutase [Feifania hominis]MBC8535313.1 phospho-sugar mutase [Feifania hominis]
MDYRQQYQAFQSALEGTVYAAELRALALDEKALEDAFYKDLEFGTAGMRGIIGLGTNRMNIFTVRRSTQGLADYLKQLGRESDGVAIAYDSRLMSETFARETALVLCQNGVRVYLYRTLHSVPQLSYAVLKLHTAAGVVITASHNPPQYNGYKVYGDDGGQLAVEDAAIVTQYIAAADLFSVRPMEETEALRRGLLTYIGDELDEQYYADVESLVLNPGAVEQAGGSLSVVYTPLHGTGNIPVRRVLTDIGIRKLHVVREQELPDPEFPTVKAPNPEEPDAFVLARRLADRVDADLILGTDPDCDRLGVCVRGRGGDFHVLTGNQIGCLLLDYILSQNEGRLRGDEFVVKSLVSTRMADVIAAHYGVELREVLTGFKFIAEQIKLSERSAKGRFLFGFEESYGYLAGTFVHDKDACIASMLVTEMACFYSLRGMTLWDALESLYERYGMFCEKVLSWTLTGIEGLGRIKGAVASLRSAPPETIGAHRVLALRDYERRVRVDFVHGGESAISLPQSDVLYFELSDDASFIVRPSGTEPKLKAYLCASAASRDEAQRKFNALFESVTKLLDKLTQE